jgi:hypothetical protein
MVFSIAFCLISVPLNGLLNTSTLILFSAGYALFFSAPLLLTRICCLKQKNIQSYQDFKNATKSIGKKVYLALSVSLLIVFSCFTIQALTFQIGYIATAYLSIVSAFLISTFTVILYFTE